MSTPIGPYTSGEIPPPLVVTFKDAAGNPLDFSVGGSWQGKWVVRQHKAGSAGEFSASDPAAVMSSAAVSPGTGATKGQVTYTWVAADFAVAGDFEGEMWVGNGVNRYASERFTWTTRAAIAIPNI